MSESSANKFCAKCGVALQPGATFCSNCGTRVGEAIPPPVQPPTLPVRRGEKEEKHEKQEKQVEKREKQEKGRTGNRSGAIVGGAVVLWLGLSLLLFRGVTGDRWWALFLAGVGIILISTGLLRWSSGRYRYPPVGYLVGGAFAFLIGVTSLVRFAAFDSLALIIIGVAIIALGIMGTRRRAPVP